MDLALLIGIIGLVVIGMEAYIRRGVQGKVKDLTDYIISDEQRSDDDAKSRLNTSTLESQMTTREFIGGGSRITGTEQSTYEYHPTDE